MRYLIAFTLLFSIFLGFGQVYDNEDDEENKEYDTKSDFFDYKKRLYLGLNNSFYVDFITSPVGTFQIEYAEPGGGVRYEDAAVQSRYLSYFTIAIEPRYNLVDFKENLALAMSAQLAAGFGSAYAASEYAASAEGFGNFQIPVMLRLYYGASATHAAQDDFGVNIGAGYELNKIGLLNFAEDRNPDLNRAWIMPAVALGVHFYRGSSPMEVNLKYGFGPIQNQKIDNFGNPILGRRTTRANSIKLSFTYLLDN
ncbi:MAG TPA: hypothetical protein DCX01_03780 [Bacteroidetes bacterium]|nr:hypothetical protein [Bacteroidota bacterium]